MPTRRVTPAVDFQKSPPNASLPPTAITSSPKATVATAAHRNHQSARHVSLSNALLRAAPSISAYAGVCTKLKNHSKPIHIIATMTCAIVNAPWSPNLVKIAIGAAPDSRRCIPAYGRGGTYQNLMHESGKVN